MCTHAIRWRQEHWQQAHGKVLDYIQSCGILGHFPFADSINLSADSADQFIKTPWSHRIAMVRCAWASERRRQKNPESIRSQCGIVPRLWHGGSSNLSIGKAWLWITQRHHDYVTWWYIINVTCESTAVCVASCCIQFFRVNFVPSLDKFLLSWFFLVKSRFTK